MRLLGTLLFVVGFILFNASNFLSKHEVSTSLIEEKVKEVMGEGEKTDKLLENLSGLEGAKYSDPISAANGIFNELSKTNKEEELWIGDYNLDQITFKLTKYSAFGFTVEHNLLLFMLSFSLAIVGALIFMSTVKSEKGAVQNDHVWHRSVQNGGWMGILLGGYLILFYCLLYFKPHYLTNFTLLTDPVSQFLKGEPGGHWFLYGFLYTLAILVMGVRMILKWWGNRYQIVRTLSVMFFQTSFAFLIPEILARLKYPSYDFKNIWPLDYDFFYDWHLDSLINSGALGIFMMVWGIALIIVAVPLLAFFFGKRWYCSWVCGCGGLAETAGDPFRQLSDKRLQAWQLERFIVHGVLVFAVIMTAVTILNQVVNWGVFGQWTYPLQKAYGFYIGALFSGVIGTGFYPLLGNRVWCRFGCPLAAYLGLVQRFKSRFRITTNGGQCISCGNCSTYCEMGIDVKWYAQRGQDVVRASCVGCGICSSVCPRGVLKLENMDESTRLMEGQPFTFGNQSFDVVEKAKSLNANEAKA